MTAGAGTKMQKRTVMAESDWKRALTFFKSLQSLHWFWFCNLLEFSRGTCNNLPSKWQCPVCIKGNLKKLLQWNLKDCSASSMGNRVQLHMTHRKWRHYLHSCKFKSQFEKQYLEFILNFQPFTYGLIKTGSINKAFCSYLACWHHG